MIKAVLFDLDGVLAFTESFYNRRRAHFLQGRGVDINENFDGTGSNDKKIWETLVPEDARLRVRLHAEYRSYSDKHPTPWKDVMNPQAKATISVLKEEGVKVAICSSSYRALIDEFSRTTGVSDLLDLVIAGEECSAYKPDPDIYLRAMEDLDVLPCETVVVEDSPLGIEAGVASGAFTCALIPPKGHSLDQGKAHLRINQLFDIVSFVRKGGRA